MFQRESKQLRNAGFNSSDIQAQGQIESSFVNLIAFSEFKNIEIRNAVCFVLV